MLLPYLQLKDISLGTWQRELAATISCATLSSQAISRSNQCSTTGITKAMVQIVHVAAAGFLSHYLSSSLPYVLFNDALNTFYLRLYGVRHMVKDHSDS